MLYSGRVPEIFVTTGATVATTITTDAMPTQFGLCYVYIEFSDDLGFGSLVTPSAGTCTLTASENGTNYGSIVNGTGFSVATADYNRVNVLGSVRNIKAVPTGVTGATYWRLRVARY